MRVKAPPSEPDIVIDVDLTQFSFVDGVIAQQGGEPATAWNYVGGIRDGSTFRAIETTGGIAENAPDVFLVDTRVFDQLEMSRLPTSISRNPQLEALVDRLEEVMAVNLEQAIEEDLELGRFGANSDNEDA